APDRGIGRGGLTAVGRIDVRAKFFFSSRRRHTRSYGDWSSDVCSSDLSAALKTALEIVRPGGQITKVRWGPQPLNFSLDPLVQRSEERRVGKEWRCAWSRGPETINHRSQLIADSTAAT